MDELREGTAQSIEGQTAQARSLKEWIRSKSADQLKGLKEFVLAVEQFLHRKFPPQHGGASALNDGPRQGHADQQLLLDQLTSLALLLFLVQQRKRHSRLWTF